MENSKIITSVYGLECIGNQGGLFQGMTENMRLACGVRKENSAC